MFVIQRQNKAKNTLGPKRSNIYKLTDQNKTI